MPHTPGPWRASEGWPSDVWHVDMPGRNYSVGVSRADSDEDMTVAEVQANAHLIAAAPEMLQALREIEEECARRLRKGKDQGDLDTLRVCRTAIAKAEGRE